MKTSQCTDAKRIALFQGSFDPFTRGHESIVRRALKIFDEVVIAIGVNINKQAFMTLDERRAWIEGVFSDEPRVRVVSYTGLTVDVARRVGATCFVRGVRMIQDFEAEMHMAEVNRELSGLETVLLYTLPGDSHVSSSIVRELVKYGRDVTAYLPSTADARLIPSHWNVKKHD